MKESIDHNFKEMHCINKETGGKVLIEDVYNEGEELFVLYYSQGNKRVDTYKNFEKQHDFIDNRKTGWI